MHHVAHMDADADPHLPFRRVATVALGKRALDFHRATHRRQRAGELDEETVAGRFDFRALMFGKQGAQQEPRCSSSNSNASASLRCASAL